MDTFEHYTQAQRGDGKEGPQVDNWQTWSTKASKPLTREEVINMAANKFLREAGHQSEAGRPLEPSKLTVWHWDEDTACHNNGRPRKVFAVTLLIQPRPKKYGR